MQNNINLQSISAVLRDEVEFSVKTLMPLSKYLYSTAAAQFIFGSAIALQK